MHSSDNLLLSDPSRDSLLILTLAIKREIKSQHEFGKEHLTNSTCILKDNALPYELSHLQGTLTCGVVSKKGSE